MNKSKLREEADQVVEEQMPGARIDRTKEINPDKPDLPPYWCMVMDYRECDEYPSPWATVKQLAQPPYDLRWHHGFTSREKAIQDFRVRA